MPQNCKKFIFKKKTRYLKLFAGLLFVFKLQKSVQPSIVEKSDKVLVGFFQSFSIFNSSQLFFLASFLSLIGFLIWFSQPISSEESECSDSAAAEERPKSSSSLKQKHAVAVEHDSINKTNEANKRQTLHEEDEDQRTEENTSASYQHQQQHHQKTVTSALRSAPKYQINTIYESSNENLYASSIQEKEKPPQQQLFNANVSKMLETAVVHDHREQSSIHSQKSTSSQSSDKAPSRKEAFLQQCNIGSKHQADYLSETTTSSSSSLSSSTNRLESDDGTNDLIRSLLDNLIIDEQNETDFEEKKPAQLDADLALKFEKVSPSSSKSSDNTAENEMRNSLLGN